MHRKESPYKLRRKLNQLEHSILSAYIDPIMDAQLNIQNGAFVSAIYQKNADDDRTSYGAVCGSNWGRKYAPSLRFMRERERVLHLFRFHRYYLPHVKHNETYHQPKWFNTNPHIIQREPGNRLYDWIKKLGNLLAGSKILLLIEDIIADETLGKRRQPLPELAISGRHNGHFLWLLMQSYTAVSLDIKRQAKVPYVWCPKSEETGILFMKRMMSSKRKRN